jgi:hypothetical protein
MPAKRQTYTCGHMKIAPDFLGSAQIFSDRSAKIFSDQQDQQGNISDGNFFQDHHENCPTFSQTSTKFP